MSADTHVCETDRDTVRKIEVIISSQVSQPKNLNRLVPSSSLKEVLGADKNNEKESQMLETPECKNNMDVLPCSDITLGPSKRKKQRQNSDTIRKIEVIINSKKESQPKTLNSTIPSSSLKDILGTDKNNESQMVVTPECKNNIDVLSCSDVTLSISKGKEQQQNSDTVRKIEVVINSKNESQPKDLNTAIPSSSLKNVLGADKNKESQILVTPECQNNSDILPCSDKTLGPSKRKKRRQNSDTIRKIEVIINSKKESQPKTLNSTIPSSSLKDILGTDKNNESQMVVTPECKNNIDVLSCSDVTLGISKGKEQQQNSDTVREIEVVINSKNESQPKDLNTAIPSSSLKNILGADKNKESQILVTPECQNNSDILPCSDKTLGPSKRKKRRQNSDTIRKIEVIINSKKESQPKTLNSAIQSSSLKEVLGADKNNESQMVVTPECKNNMDVLSCSDITLGLSKRKERRQNSCNEYSLIEKEYNTMKCWVQSQMVWCKTPNLINLQSEIDGVQNLLQRLENNLNDPIFEDLSDNQKYLKHIKLKKKLDELLCVKQILRNKPGILNTILSDTNDKRNSNINKIIENKNTGNPSKLTLEPKNNVDRQKVREHTVPKHEPELKDQLHNLQNLCVKNPISIASFIEAKNWAATQLANKKPPNIFTLQTEIDNTLTTCKKNKEQKRYVHSKINVKNLNEKRDKLIGRLKQLFVIKQILNVNPSLTFCETFDQVFATKQQSQTLKEETSTSSQFREMYFHPGFLQNSCVPYNQCLDISSRLGYACTPRNTAVFDYNTTSSKRRKLDMKNHTTVKLYDEVGKSVQNSIFESSNLPMWEHRGINMRPFVQNERANVVPLLKNATNVPSTSDRMSAQMELRSDSLFPVRRLPFASNNALRPAEISQPCTNSKNETGNLRNYNAGSVRRLSEMNMNTFPNYFIP